MKMGSSCFYADILLFPGQCFIVNLFVCCLRYSFMRMFAYVPWYVRMGHLQYFAITNNTTENTFIINFHFFPFIILKWYFFVYFQSSQRDLLSTPFLFCWQGSSSSPLAGSIIYFLLNDLLPVWVFFTSVVWCSIITHSWVSHFSKQLEHFSPLFFLNSS